MSKTLIKILKVNGKVNRMKKQYSVPKIYCGGGNIEDWDSKTEEEKKILIEKDWFVYYRYRDPSTDLLVQQKRIKIGNNYKTKKERYAILKEVQKKILTALENGYNPYFEQDNNQSKTIKEALTFCISLKKDSISERYYADLKRVEKSFISFLQNTGRDNELANKIDRKIVNSYLNHILIDKGSKTRNDAKSQLNGIFNEMENQEIIENNFIKSIQNIKRTKKRSRTYSSKQVNDIISYVQKNDTQMLLFINFVSYLFLRPVEIIRLTVGDINLHDNLIEDKTKTKNLKTKIIPSLLKEDIINYLNQYPNSSTNDFLFTNKGISTWDRKEDGRRSYFTNKYRNEVKKPLNIPSGYDIYSFRHTYTTKMFKYITSQGKSKTKL